MSDQSQVLPSATLQSKSIPLRSYTIPEREIENILNRLQAIVARFGEAEVAAYLQSTDLPQSEIASKKAEILSQSFRVTTTVSGAENESVLAPTVQGVFNENTPRQITKIFATNRTAYRTYTGREPIFSFDVTFDFRSSPILDTNPVSDPTLNDSFIYIQGDENWVSSVEEAVMGVLRNYRSQRAALHGPFVYDLGVFAAAIPFALAVSYFFQPLVDELFGAAHGVVYAAAYIYLFYVVLMLYRFLFGYARWLFPIFDLERGQSRPKKHRGVWLWLGLAIFGAWIGYLAVPW